MRVLHCWKLKAHHHHHHHHHRHRIRAFLVFRPDSYSIPHGFTRVHFSTNGASSTSQTFWCCGAGRSFLLPGATMGTIIMLAVLHARRLYYENQMEDARVKGEEVEFVPDAKASVMRLLPMRSISRFWGFITSMELPVGLRSFVYKGWARAFHSNLNEVDLPLEEYASLQEFFTRRLKDGSRPLDPDPSCLVSPVYGIVLSCGELREPGALIQQVKGFSYSASSLLGTSLSITSAFPEEGHEVETGNKSQIRDLSKSWWRVSWASPKLRNPDVMCPTKGIFYCVIYLKPGDYHRVHSPVDWNIAVRRHFSGRLFPLNERATRTIKNLHIENERVVLEGQWSQGYMAIAAIGAALVGSIQVLFEPELRTNQPKEKLLKPELPNERVYEPEGTGLTIKKGDEVVMFRMGSTVVLVFEAPQLELDDNGSSSSCEFRFCVKKGDKVRMGEAIGRIGDL